MEPPTSLSEQFKTQFRALFNALKAADAGVTLDSVAAEAGIQSGRKGLHHFLSGRSGQEYFPKLDRVFKAMKARPYLVALPEESGANPHEVLEILAKLDPVAVEQFLEIARQWPELTPKDRRVLLAGVRESAATERAAG